MATKTITRLKDLADEIMKYKTARHVTHVSDPMY